MRSSLRAIWLSVNAIYWFIPTLLTLGAFLLALTTIHLDRLFGSDWLTDFSWFYSSRPDGARAQLTVISSAMIAISSTVFAITIAAVAYASGNYGPRLLTNFMDRRGNQYSLGTFIATFTYNLVVLRGVRSPEETPALEGSRLDALTGFVPLLSMLVSAASAVVAVAVLVYFLHHSPASIRINTVLGGIGRKLLKGIERRCPAEGGSSGTLERKSGTPIASQSIGYIEIIDFAELDEIARRNELTIALRVRTGDFIHPHIPVAGVSGEWSEELGKRILDCFALGESRTPTQDLEFLIDELAEIALRALSPGINDPFTAITSIHWMGAALAKLADRDLGQGPEQESYDLARVQPVTDDFDHFVQRSFGTLRSSAAASPLAAKVFIEALSHASIGALSARRQATLRREAETLVQQAELELRGPAIQEVRDRLSCFDIAA